MDKKDWGIDFNKSPIVCPTCGMVYDTEYLSKRKAKVASDKVDEDIIVDDDVIMSDENDEDIVSLDDEASEDDMVSLDDDSK